MKKNKEDLEKLRQRVLELLKKSKNTNYQIGKDTGITEATIGNYRNKKTKPTEANANILIKYLTGEGERIKNGNAPVNLNNEDWREKYYVLLEENKLLLGENKKLSTELIALHRKHLALVEERGKTKNFPPVDEQSVAAKKGAGGRKRKIR
jgi:hypothetical protein